jgi:hypothetical protein
VGPSRRVPRDVDISSEGLTEEVLIGASVTLRRMSEPAPSFVTGREAGQDAALEAHQAIVIGAGPAGLAAAAAGFRAMEWSGTSSDTHDITIWASEQLRSRASHPPRWRLAVAH